MAGSVAGLVLLASLTYSFVQSAVDAARNHELTSLVAYAPTYAQEMALLGHYTVTPDTPADDPAYLRMIEAEKRWVAVNPGVADIYTFRKMPDDRILFLVDAETDYDRNGVYEGERESRTVIGEQMVKQARDPIDRAMGGTAVVDGEIYTDRWGTWITGYAPIRGPEGEPEALVGVDYPAAAYLAALAAARIRALLQCGIAFCVLLLLSVVFAMTRGNAEREERHSQLDAAAREVRRVNASLESSVRDRTLQLETANRELESFAYPVSHDLRTPLRSIEGFAQLVVDEVGDNLPVEAKENLDRVQKAGRRMAGLIDDLLRLSRVTRAELRRDNIDITALATRIGDEIASGYPDRHVQLVVPAGLVAWCDSHLVEVLLRNLLENAWKYTAHREVAIVEVGCDSEGVWFVRDNGCGFDMRFVKRLFQPFQRLHSEDEFEGNGIGLATVARVVTMHGGRVRAQSDGSTGCTISSTLAPGWHAVDAEEPPDSEPDSVTLH